MPPNSTSILATLILCGFMGLLGQGIRAAVGLKNAASSTGPDGNPNQQSEFNAAYFLISLMIGFIAGVIAGLVIGLDTMMHVDPLNTKVLLGIAASGYAGADFIENTFSQLLPGVGASPAAPKIQPAVAAVAGGQVPVVPPAAPGPTNELIGLAAALRVAAPKLNGSLWITPLSDALTKFGMTSHRRISAAIGQFLVEAGAAFQELAEDLNYTHAARLVAVFPHEFPTEESAVPYVGHPEALANKVYANKNGNGDEASGDGFRFRGRGLIQLTGRTEYTAFASAAGKTLDETPAFCETVGGAAMSGCWYLSAKGCLPLADAWQLNDITRAVNGSAMEGAAQRVDYSNAMLKALGG